MILCLCSIGQHIYHKYHKILSQQKFQLHISFGMVALKQRRISKNKIKIFSIPLYIVH